MAPRLSWNDEERLRKKLETENLQLIERIKELDSILDQRNTRIAMLLSQIDDLEDEFL